MLTTGSQPLTTFSQPLATFSKRLTSISTKPTTCSKALTTGSKRLTTGQQTVSTGQETLTPGQATVLTGQRPLTPTMSTTAGAKLGGDAPVDDPRRNPPQLKALSSARATGGLGTFFEWQTVTLFVVRMMARGVVPCLGVAPIGRIMLQAGNRGYKVDDFIVEIKADKPADQKKLLVQVKYNIELTARSRVYAETIKTAWNDFTDDSRFRQDCDAIAIATNLLNKRDAEGMSLLLERARHERDAGVFFKSLKLPGYISDSARDKLKAVRAHVDAAVGGPVRDDLLLPFLRHLHVLPMDLDATLGTTQSDAMSLIEPVSPGNSGRLWAQIFYAVARASWNAGTLDPNNVPQDVQKAFSWKANEVNPPSLGRAIPPASLND